MSPERGYLVNNQILMSCKQIKQNNAVRELSAKVKGQSFHQIKCEFLDFFKNQGLSKIFK